MTSIPRLGGDVVRALREPSVRDPRRSLPPVAAVAILSVDANDTPVEVTGATIKTAILRKATEELDVMPTPAEFSTIPWSDH